MPTIEKLRNQLLLFLFLAGVCLPINLPAQLRWSLEGGLGSSWAHLRIVSWGTYPGHPIPFPAIMLGGGMRWQPTKALAMGVSLQYTQLGHWTRFNGEVTTGGSSSSSVVVDNGLGTFGAVYLPLSLGWCRGDWSFMGGGQVGLLPWGRFRNWGRVKEGSNSGASWNNPWTETQFRPLDYGFHASVHRRLDERWELAVRYAHGLGNISKTPSTQFVYRTRLAMVQMAWRL